MGLQADDITDLANSTLNDLGRFRIVEIGSDITRHVAMRQIMNENRVTFDGGKGIQWNLLTDGDDNARNVGLYNVDNVNVVDASITMEIPWRHTTGGCSFDVREAAMNSGPSKIVDFVKLKRYQMLISWTKLCETNWWEGPSDATDEDTPFGFFGYWGVYNSTTGFNGGDHPNFSGGPGGKSTTTYPRLKHYTFNYAAITDADLVTKIRECLVKTDFQPIVPNAPIPDYATRSQRTMYTNYDVLAPLESLARSNNDNLGNDLAKYDGQVHIQRIPMEYVPHLEDQHDTSDPVIGIDWGCVRTTFQKGQYMRVTPFYNAPAQHNVRLSHLDSSYNFQVINRRKGIWLGAKSDPLNV